MSFEELPIAGITDLLVAAIALLYFFGVWRPGLVEKLRGREELAVRLSAVIALFFLIRAGWRFVEMLAE